MNKIGIHGSVWTGKWDGDDGVRAIQRTADSGFDFLELPLSDPKSIAVVPLRNALSRNHVDVTASLGLTTDTDISSSDKTIVQRGIAHLGEAISVLRDLGGKDLAGVIFSAMRKYTKPATERGIDHAMEALRVVAEQAQRADIRLHLEVVNRYESNVFNTGEQAVAFLKKTQSPVEIGVHLDTYHMNIEEGVLGRAIERCGKHIGYFHVGESHRGYLGTGTINWGEGFRALHHINYQGPIAFESFSSAVVDANLSNTLGVWRNLWSDGEHLARHARGFIAAQMEAAVRAEAM